MIIVVRVLLERADAPFKVPRGGDQPKPLRIEAHARSSRMRARGRAVERLCVNRDF